MQKPAGHRLPELVAIMRRLLSPDGCPWDREQTLDTLKPYVIEEAHEVVDAIERGDMGELKEELGDLLLQVVFQAELVGEAFDVDDVVGAICDKLVRRHPHVFAAEQADSADAVRESWEAIKAKERAEKGDRGVLDSVPVGMPALLRAQRMAEKAAHLGLDWRDAHGPRAKLDEELRELDDAIAGGDPASIEHELGDALFALANLGRKHGVEPEAALRGTLARFATRVRHVEGRMKASGKAPTEHSEQEVDVLWREAKNTHG